MAYIFSDHFGEPFDVPTLLDRLYPVERDRKGGFGRVVLCRNVLDLGVHVIKLVPFDQKDKCRVLSEVRALRRSQHPNVIPYYHCWIEAGIYGDPKGYASDDPEQIVEDPASACTLFIAMEHCPSTLKDKLTEPIPKEEILELFKQLMQGLSHLHDVGVAHLDLKPENIFIDSYGKLKIGDFGIAVVKEENEHVYHRDNGSREYLNLTYSAPELKEELKEQKSTFSEKVDAYSAGLILLEMKCSPLSTVSEKCRLLEDARVAKFPDELDNDEQMKVLNGLLEGDPADRMGAKDVLREFF